MSKICKVPVSKTHQYLMLEWDFYKNDIRPEEVTYGSGKKVWWLCIKCDYAWKTTIYTRTSGHGCPACAGRVATKNNNLTVNFPGLAKEWSSRNIEDPYNFTPGSGKKVWWECSVCKYEWESFIYNRTLYGKGCPMCAGSVVKECDSIANKYPLLYSEWSELNSISPEECTIGSHRKIWWVCSICFFVWKSAIYNRANGKGCPACAGRVVTEKNNLAFKYPVLSIEWSSRNIKGPIKYSSKSSAKVWWECSLCSFEWRACISNRANGSGCPACAGKVVTEIYNLFILYPELVKEWSDRNINGPSEYLPGSHKKVWWDCSACKYSWRAAIYSRVQGSGCPACAIGPVSNISQTWLNTLNISSLKREYYIEDLGLRVDGYDPNTNTVYEFLGDYWHGNPEIYNPRDKNLHNKKSFGKLYDETFIRLECLEKAGYKVVYIWEKDYKNKTGKVY